MKKLIINALGIGSLVTLMAMVVMTICWKNESRINNNISDNRSASTGDRTGRLGDNIKPQNVVASGGTYSSNSNLSYVYESSGSDYSDAYDPTDYPSGGGESFDASSRLKVNRIDNYTEIKAAEVIE